MLFRYRARSYPQTLNADEAGRWREFCARRLSDESYGGYTVNKFREELSRLESAGHEDADGRVLRSLREYLVRLGAAAGLSLPANDAGS